MPSSDEIVWAHNQKNSREITQPVIVKVADVAFGAGFNLPLAGDFVMGSYDESQILSVICQPQPGT